MAHSSHRRWKGCCLMCGYLTIRGSGRATRDPWNVNKKIGKKRRLRRGDLGDAAEW